MRRAQVVWLVSFLGLLGYLGVLHLGAPDVLPMRYGFDGEPVAWATREGYFLFAFGFTLFMNLMFGASSTRQAFSVIPPKYWNIPHKDYWLAPERGREGLDRIGDLMAWGGIATNATMGFVYWLVDAQSSGAITGTTLNGAVIGILVSSFALLPLIYWYMRPPGG